MGTIQFNFNLTNHIQCFTKAIENELLTALTLIHFFLLIAFSVLAALIDLTQLTENLNLIFHWLRLNATILSFGSACKTGHGILNNSHFKLLHTK